jgi:succinate-acetate transporter protein
MYTDRPYYTNSYLFWSPIFTLFNYFRTLNVVQVLSWIFWILLLAFINSKISNNEELKYKITVNKLIAVAGIASALFMLWLGFSYHTEIQNVLNSDNDVYEEYSTILFYAGSAFLIYSAIITFFRFKNK